MKILGIDYGSHNVGIAISDSAAKIAFPKNVVPNDSSLIETILSIIQDEEVTHIVVGESKDFSGKDNPIMRRVHAFIEQLRARTSCTVHLEPEFMTSVEARRGREDVVSKKIDAAAATLILQSFIDRKN